VEGRRTTLHLTAETNKKNLLFLLSSDEFQSIDSENKIKSLFFIKDYEENTVMRSAAGVYDGDSKRLQVLLNSKEFKSLDLKIRTKLFFYDICNKRETLFCSCFQVIET